MTARSGKFVLRVGAELHQELEHHARLSNISLNEACLQLLKQSLKLNQSSRIDNKIVSSLRKLYEVDGLGAVLLFGSTARGTAQESSDIDVLLVVNATTPIHRSLYRKFESLEKNSGFEKLSLHFVHLPDLTSPSSLWKEVAMDGMILWEKPDFGIVPVIHEIKNQIMSGKFTRKTANGQPYWVMNEVL